MQENQKPSVSLSQVMQNAMNETKNQSDMTDQPQQTVPSQEQQPSPVEQGPVQQSPNLLPSEIESNPVFKALPQAQKEKFRERGYFDPDDDLFNDAIEQSNNEYLEMLNRKREQEGKEPISEEDFKASIEGTAPVGDAYDDDDDDYMKDFRRRFDEAVGEYDSSEEEESEEEIENKRLREFHRQLEDAIPVSFDDDVENPDSAAIDFKINYNTEYVETMKSVLTENGIKFKTKKKGGLKKGLLKSFVQRNPHVTTPLVNSGFYVTLSGASIPEVIQMNIMDAKKRSEAEMKKIGFIQKHLVGSSIGEKLSASQLSQLIYYKDLQTLYFNLFIGTFPDENEFPVTCENDKCQQEIKLKIHAADLVLNADEFQNASQYILYHNKDVKDVLEQSAISREKQKILHNKVLVSFHNPSVWDVIRLSTQIEDLQDKKDLSTFTRVIGYLMYINYVALVDEDGDYVKYDDIEDMLEVLRALDEQSMDQIDEEIEEYAEKNVVKYGFKEYQCPKCRRVHKEREMDMSEFLFILSQTKWTINETKKLLKKDQLRLTEGK